MASAQYVGTEHRLLSAQKPHVQTASLGEDSNNQRHTARAGMLLEALLKITLGQATES